ncbi:MAG: phospho-N-acetylmuramoyl-pentapeptide-transferase [bacterium]|nr:phospho-N-acetylmuramoyl-pentapeptide-transferase [bacterium]
MEKLLGLILLSFFITALLVVPFIDILYKLKFRRVREQNKEHKIFDKLHNHKVGTPVGGGLLVIVVIVVLSILVLPILNLPLESEILSLIVALLGFGALGLYDDIHKFFQFPKTGVWGLRMKPKFVIQWIIGLVIGCILYFGLGFENLYIAGLGNFNMGIAYILFAAFVIVAFSNAVNITDGLDGLAGGLLIICLFGFMVIASAQVDPVLQVFLGLWIGAMFAFLYFNVFPARIWMGDVGALAFGAALGVVALLTAKVFAMVIIGGLFIVEVGTSALQLLSKKYRGKKIWAIAPLHHNLLHKGWEEPKIVMRFWLIGAIFAIFGVWLSTIK